MVQIGTGTYVRHSDIIQIISLMDKDDMSDIQQARVEGRVIAIGGKPRCTAVYLKDGRIFLSPLSAKTIRNRFLAANWTGFLDRQEQ